MRFDADVQIRMPERTVLSMSGVISGKGRLVYNGHGAMWGGGKDDCSTLFIDVESKNKNTYSGGTVINGGRIQQMRGSQPLGTGPIILNDGEIRCREKS